MSVNKYVIPLVEHTYDLGKETPQSQGSICYKSVNRVLLPSAVASFLMDLCELLQSAIKIRILCHQVIERVNL